MKPIAWDERALDDLEAIAEYIAADSPRAALRVVEAIRAAAVNLSYFPETGRAADGFREYIVTRYPYLLIYENLDDEMRIRAIFHQHQDRP